MLGGLLAAFMRRIFRFCGVLCDSTDGCFWSPNDEIEGLIECQLPSLRGAKAVDNTRTALQYL